jgi:gamma-glutamylcyclotransferase (GGCT)/AIG2-like uncharacterized protein YtfP
VHDDPSHTNHPAVRVRQGGLAGWLDEDTIGIDTGFAVGKMYSLGSYPGVTFTEEGTVVGEVREVFVTESVLSCITMEQHAGYQLVEIEVRPDPSSGLVDKAWAFHMPAEEMKYMTKKEVIDHGDWLRFEEERDQARAKLREITGA